MVSTRDKDNSSYQAALQVAQQAIALLLKWTDTDLPVGYSYAENFPVVERAKELLGWTDHTGIGALHLLFDRVCLEDEQCQEPAHYVPMKAIADSKPLIPYPSKDQPDSAAQNAFKQDIKLGVLKVLHNPENWKNLSFLMLIIEKYGSCLCFGESDVALVDKVRITGAVAAALVENSSSESLTLIAGDLSGIQSFIYTIASDGALKSLRARSFYLELVTEEVVQRLLAILDLPRTSIIYAGGGNLYLLASGTSETSKNVQQVQDQFNRWFLDKFQKKIFLALVCLPFPTEEVSTEEFVNHWQEAIRQLNQQKAKKFAQEIAHVLSPQLSYEQICRICHRDDVEEKDLKPLKDPDSPLACPTCQMMFQLGDELFGVTSIVRSSQRVIEKPVYTIEFSLGQKPSDSVYYHLFRGNRPVIQNSESSERSIVAFLIDNWNPENYQFQYFQSNVTLLLLGNYAQEVTEDKQKRFIRAEEMAVAAQGIDRVGYLRMDVDFLGRIFATGLKSCFWLPRLAGLSRQMSYFFKVYLNTLAETRQLPESAHKLTNSDKPECDRPNLLFIYAGGDDLFISGAWNEVVEFAFDVYQSFRAYTGNNPDITLSGGISIDDIKFPLYQSAELSKDLEDLAKGNGRDSLGLFGKPFKWNQWLGATESGNVEKLINELDDKEKEHLDIKDKPDWLGILPFVRSLHAELKGSYSRNFVRNLLITAELQEQAIREKQKQIDDIKKKQSDAASKTEIAKLEDEQEEIRYYLHLPKIVYTLARLPDRLRKPDPITKEDKFKPIRTSLKSPYNAPYFRAIATWIELLTRNNSGS